MQKFVHSYLSASFVLKKVKFTQKDEIFGYDAIFPVDSVQQIYGDKLLKELVLAAYIDEVRLRRFVNEWVKLNYPNADLKVYWDTPEPRNVKVTLTTEPNQNGRIYTEELVERIRNQVIALQNQPTGTLYGELDHPNQPIFISSKQKKDLDNTE